MTGKRPLPTERRGQPRASVRPLAARGAERRLQPAAAVTVFPPGPYTCPSAPSSDPRAFAPPPGCRGARRPPVSARILKASGGWASSRAEAVVVIAVEVEAMVTKQVQGCVCHGRRSGDVGQGIRVVEPFRLASRGHDPGRPGRQGGVRSAAGVEPSTPSAGPWRRSPRCATRRPSGGRSAAGLGLAWTSRPLSGTRRGRLALDPHRPLMSH